MSEKHSVPARLLVAFLVVLSIGLVVAAYIKHLADAKIAHEATAIVRGRDLVRYDETHHSYVDDEGVCIDRQPGDDEWRVYYEIISFRGFDEHTAKRLREAEEQRVADGRMRYTILFKDEYDKVDLGDLLTVIYQRITNSRLIIDTTIDFRKPARQ
jgi:hypothetical protein